MQPSCEGPLLVEWNKLVLSLIYKVSVAETYYFGRPRCKGYLHGSIIYVIPKG